MSPARISSIIQPILLVLFVIFILMVLYGYFSQEEYDDDTVTITFNCTHVLSNQDKYPSFVIDQCKSKK